MSTAATLLRQARTRAGLSQRALARRAGTAQSVIARIERGQTSPTWETLERLLDAAGVDISAQLEPRVVVGSHMLDDVSRILRMTPEPRLAEVKNMSAFSAGLQGLPRATYDADITPAKGRDNLQRLAAALRELGARIYTEQIPEG